MKGCLVIANQATVFGPGMYAHESSLQISDTYFGQNQGLIIENSFGCHDSEGGGAHLVKCDASFVDCELTGNHCETAASVSIAGGRSRFDSCLLAENHSDSIGGLIIRSTAAEVLFDSCTLSNNINEDNGVTFSIEEGASVLFRNSIVRKASSEANLIEGAGTVLASYSNLEGGFPGEGNIDADPVFVDPANGDYRLQMGSPCIDSASNAGPSTDLDGYPRPVDIIGLGREGPGAFDMGAYEFQAPRSDLNSDGYVNEMDLMIFQQDWMKVSGP